MLPHPPPPPPPPPPPKNIMILKIMKLYFGKAMNDYLSVAKLFSQLNIHNYILMFNFLNEIFITTYWCLIFFICLWLKCITIINMVPL